MQTTRISNLADVVRVHARETGSKPCLTFQDRTITYAEMDARSSRVANALLADGIRPQEHVAFLAKNRPEYFEVLYGGAKANAINVAINWRLAAPEMLYVINDAESQILFVEQEFFGHVDQIRANLKVRKIVALDPHPEWPSYEDWLGGASEEDPQLPLDPEDVCFQLYTSGTTGLPKGAMLSNRNLFGLLDIALPEWGFAEPDAVNLLAMPLFHIAGCGWGVVGMYVGGHTVMLREVDPNEILAAIPRYGVTNALFVPAVLQFLLMMPQTATTDFSTLRCIVYGASPITEDVLVKSMETFKCGFAQAYGLTESTGAVTILRPDDHDPGGPRAKLLRSAGVPFPGLEIEIRGPAGEAVPDGQVGEIWIRGNQVMKGYWNMPDETAKAITSDGWLRSGDAGFFEDGYLYLYDRVKDMIVSGGENVYPAEVENALMSHPDIADVAVIGVPDDTWGEAVKAVVVRAPGSEISEAGIVAFAKERIAGYKCPKSVDFVEALPRNPSGKILKRELREPYWQGVERRIH